ncbi:MAG TPA: ADP-glyceromanno-heptose 6-epimerase [Xanthobacteraceae bacterium]|nr:ADP-glyceromanno-heptose 6-epimerase [Xanthobacteraceae bacterium]
MILVTGGAGFIGSNLVASLNERGVTEIAVSDHLDAAKERNLAKRRYSEIVAPDDILRWLSGRKCEAILHMGAISSTTATDEHAVMAANFELPLRLLEWCRDAKTPFIYASSAATYGDGSLGFDDDNSPQALARLMPLNLYGRSKARFDVAAAARAHAGVGMPPQWVGLKFFNVFGPNEYHKGDMRSVLAKVFPEAKAGQPVRLFKSDRPDIAGGEIVRDFIYVEDAAKIVLWLMDHPHVSGVYNVGTGKARSFDDMMRTMLQALGRKPEIEHIAIPQELAGRYQYFTEARMERLVAAGYDAPFTPLEAAVERYVKQYLDRPDPYR